MTTSLGTAKVEHLTMGSSVYDANVENPPAARIEVRDGKGDGTLVVDRFLFPPMHHLCNYGFVPRTLSGKGDACDLSVAPRVGVLPAPS